MDIICSHYCNCCFTYIIKSRAIEQYTVLGHTQHEVFNLTVLQIWKKCLSIILYEISCLFMESWRFTQHPSYGFLREQVLLSVIRIQYVRFWKKCLWIVWYTINSLYMEPIKEPFIASHTASYLTLFKGCLI